MLPIWDKVTSIYQYYFYKYVLEKKTVRIKRGNENGDSQVNNSGDAIKREGLCQAEVTLDESTFISRNYSGLLLLFQKLKLFYFSKVTRRGNENDNKK